MGMMVNQIEKTIEHEMESATAGLKQGLYNCIVMVLLNGMGFWDIL